MLKNLVLQNNNIAPTNINDNKTLETAANFPNDDLKMAYLRQSEELRLITRQLANSQLRIKELEEQIKKYSQKSL